MKSKKINKKKLQKKFISIVVIISIVLVIAGKMYLGFKVDLGLNKIHKLEAQKKELANKTNLLRAQVDRLRNVDRISKIASEKFGLVVNTEEIGYIELNTEAKEEVKERYAKLNEKKKKFKVAGVY